ncbi:MAG: hypothetical protein NWE98_08530 [Candidatus Bathyarchaeota archaeon]|nr:hypothetical protein [Candidatus Bathyarchaeota archaeon]
MIDEQNSTTPQSSSTIKCECGFEILVVPDIKSVGSAIDGHIEQHRKNQPDSKQADMVAKRIHQMLFRQLFEKIGGFYI